MRVPRATYRVQLTPDFGFEDVRRIVPYLGRLGIGSLYCSPILTARSGSRHGYDVSNPHQLNPELGTRADFDRLVASLHEHGIGLLLDIVPNHMAASVENPWWVDVLANGQVSPYAHYFDIEWDSAIANGILENRVLLPILGAPYGETLESGQLQLTLEGDQICLGYYETALPLNIDSLVPVVAWRQPELERALAGEPELQQDYRWLIDVEERFARDAAPETDAELRDQARAQLGRLLRNPTARAHFERAMEEINGRPGEPRSFDLLDRIIGRQAYRLAFWELARERINYRRFFDINDLVSMRVEDRNVFEDTHRLILELARDGAVDGLRVDHIDGLRDPLGYLRRLQQELPGGGPRPFYVLAEKILAPGEELPADWPLSGTTGYDFLNELGWLYIDRDNDRVLDEIYRRWGGLGIDFPELAYRKKLQVLDDLFAGSVTSLARWLDQIAEGDRHGRDIPLASLRRALMEITASLPIYRTYIRTLAVSAQDRRWIERAVSDAARRRPELSYPLSFLRRLLLLETPSYLSEDERKDWLSFVMRWQQFTGPVMAKGYEDTALYIYNRLVAQNEVGGHPDLPGVDAGEFHTYLGERAARWPHTMNASSTHDTKRGEDVRARLSVLSELAGEWEARLDRWSALNLTKRTVVEEQPVPDGNTELLLYQTLLGAWPLREVDLAGFPERIKLYLVKAAREAKERTSWAAPNEPYEAALTAFVDRLLDFQESAEFLADFRPFQERLAYWGALTSLSQLLIKLTAPGVPDIYQGNELWALDLVDPDNRRPVDFDSRQRQLDALIHAPPAQPADLFADWRDGRVKLWLTLRALQLRQEEVELFRDGDYIPLSASGELSPHIVAYARHRGPRWALIIAPRLIAGLAEPEEMPVGECWGATELELPAGAPARWGSRVTGERVELGQGPAKVSAWLAQVPLGLWLSV